MEFGCQQALTIAKESTKLNPNMDVGGMGAIVGFYKLNLVYGS